MQGEGRERDDGGERGDHGERRFVAAATGAQCARKGA